jgi:hypothetical protein
VNRDDKRELRNLGRFVRALFTDPRQFVRDTLAGSEEVEAFKEGLQGTPSRPVLRRKIKRVEQAPVTHAHAQRCASCGSDGHVTARCNVIDAEFVEIKSKDKSDESKGETT